MQEHLDDSEAKVKDLREQLSQQLAKNYEAQT